ncbi:uncharacterized protein (TIGR03083 family) [Streptacidiphilus sp. MAP12-16]|uniref:maleylpyruvate isomerase family mycothiol-dependent enzyme n=1 Tax=Streptacidiphilus sp. MAP12-16 TaxID=3156300 RepID=UPI0035123E7C
MATTSPWPMIHAERRALLADARTLDADQWSTPSLCAGWTVRDVFAHLTATSMMTPGRFFGKLAGAGFSFQTMTAKDIAEMNSGTVEDNLSRFSERLEAVTSPPGPVDAMLGEALVHGEDFRKPLGLSREYPTDALARAADFYRGSNLLIGAKRRIEGLRLRAVDADWSTGAGPEVVGPMASLLLAMTGRRAALEDLHGDGVTTLSARM